MQRYLAIFSCGFMTALVSGCPEDSKGTLDDDADGHDINTDCDDSDPDVHPGAFDICDDGIDNDCSGSDAECLPGGDDDGPLDEDQDNDGFSSDGEDCDDNDPDINPDAHEDCMVSGDENCDGYEPQCVRPDLIYAPTSAGTYDAYGVGVFLDYVVFGEPSSGEPGIGDGRALFFELEPGGVVDESDAAVVNEGPVGAGSAYGTVVTPVGVDLCIGADYLDFNSASDVGKNWCYSATAVWNSAGNLQLADASYTTTGTVDFDFSNVEGEADVNGDFVQDLLVYSSHGVHVILGDGSGWSGDYVVPDDADLTFGGCASSNTGWCGFARAIMPGYPGSFAISDEGGTADDVSLYDFPLAGGAPVPTATSTVDRSYPDSAAALISEDAFAFGNMVEHEVTFLDSAGNVLGTLQGPPNSSFGYWVTTAMKMDGREVLLVGAPDAESPEPGSNSRGLVYVFNVDYVGLPTHWKQAEYILLPPAEPGDFLNCGHRARAGNTYVENDSYVNLTVATGCRGHGGAAYNLYREFNGSRLVGGQDIYSVGPGEYRIRQWVVNAFTNHLDWLKYLAQTEAVHNAQNQIVGWRLHKIAVDSPLHRAGLRNGDIIGRINGVDTTTPAVINALYDAVQGSTALTIGFVRNGTPRLFSYAIVP
jgi:hypothetical protein